MAFSYMRPSSQGHGNYSRIATLTTELELEKRHLIADDSASDDFDSLPLPQHYSEKTSSFRRPRIHRYVAAALLSVVIVTASLAALGSPKAGNGKEEWKVEPVPQCAGCSYSALPAFPPPSSPEKAFTEDELDSWIAQGHLPVPRSSRNHLDLSKHTRLDVVTFWVNGSDPRHAAARSHYAANPSQVASHLETRSIDDDRLQNKDERYREQNELLYNLRSSRENLLNLGTSHVVTTDFPDDGHNQVEGFQDRLFEGRRGQVPSWLDMKSELVAYGGELRRQNPALRLHHDWETFAPLVETTEEIQAWREKRLPTFNSMAAEAVLGANLPGLAEYSILSSDDMFIGQPMSTADFVTPLYGPVFHLKMSQMVYAGKRTIGEGPEFAGLDYSVNLLSKRFGTRLFPYLHHVHKVLSKPLLIESRMMWKAEFEEATLKRFRGDGVSANSHMLSYGLIIERHREALLWSFLVNKLDVNGDGKLDKAETERAYRLMGTDGVADITARIKSRTTSSPDSISESLDAVSFPRPLATKYTYSSLDGYLLSQPSAAFTNQTGYQLKQGPLAFSSSPNETPQQQQRFTSEFCRVSMKTCWPQSDDVSRIFTQFAFQEPSCGDCLIAQLVEQSGSAGLEAFLPVDRSARMPRAEQSAEVPHWAPAHLSMDNDWKAVDFSLSSVASINRAGWSRRAFSVHLIQRYNYVVGDASVSFNMLFGPGSATETFNHLLSTRPAFICLNDDIKERLSETRTIMQNFFQAMWSSSTALLPFERA